MNQLVLKGEFMVQAKRLNHAVLYVSDLDQSINFYKNLLGFDLVSKQPPMAFLRAQGSSNHHDLGLLALGVNARHPAGGSTGLYHLAWEVPSFEDLAKAKEDLIRMNAYVGESDHGATKSVYGQDPDEIEFEIMYLLPREKWGSYENRAVTMPLRWS